MTSDNHKVIGNFQVVGGKIKTRREVLLMGALAAGSLVSVSQSMAAAEKPLQKAAAQPAATALLSKSFQTLNPKDFSSLTSKKLEGFSTSQIEQHLKLYTGYVAKTNEIQLQLNTVDINAPAPNATYAPLRELLLEQSFALNGVIYHELYFSNLGGSGGEPTGDLRSALEARWGNLGKFMDYFKAAGKCMRGWVIVGWNARAGQIHAYGLDTHNMWVPANVVPIVVLDVYEHAYMIDYGINRSSYLEAFLKNLDWEVCAKRFAVIYKHASGLDSTT